MADRLNLIPMKRISLIITFAIAGSLPAAAQFTAQTGATFFIGSGATVAFDGLIVQPSSDLTIGGLTITKSATPLTEPTSIARVYNFSEAINFSGTLGIRYAVSELNGLNEDELLIATRTDGTFAWATGSITDTDEHYVSAAFASPLTFKQVTALSSKDPLPVTLVNFSLHKEEQQASLTWETTLEINASHFDVERSADGRLWQNIGRVAAKGNSNSPATYAFRDPAPLSDRNGGSLRYYRLKMSDLDDTFTYSNILSASWEIPLPVLSAYPNPATTRLKIETSVPGRLLLYDVAGRRLRELDAQAGVNEIDVRSLPAGMYFVEFNGSSLRWVKMQ